MNLCSTATISIDFVERKLQRHSIGKIVPPDDWLANAYRLFANGRRAEEIVRHELAKLNGGMNMAVPSNLREQVAQYLKDHPTERWDRAVAAILSSSQTT
jgi:hypothetical protein